MTLRLIALAATVISFNAFAQPDLAATAAKEKGAIVTPSGLVYRSLRDGSGANPTAADTV